MTERTNLSPAEIFADLTEEERSLKLSQLSDKEIATLAWHWPFWARPDQLEPPGDWTTWLILAGRGWGKTRTGAETVRQWVMSGRYKRIALVGETTADVRGVMVDGESGLLNLGPEDDRPEYFPSLRQLKWKNGAIATTYNATEPDQLRGPQHDAAWCDELAKWKYMQETWDQLQFGLRLGTHPKQIITTTPQPKPLIRALVNNPSVLVTRGRTYDNRANLASPFISAIEERFGGTRLGRQELEGEILNDIPGALWSRDIIDSNRLVEPPQDLDRVIVAVDPAASSAEGSDENGIVVVGLARDTDGYARGYILEDGSLRGSPEEWSRRAVHLYRKWEADRIVAEKNQGGEMVLSVLRSADRSVPVKLVHASRGKAVRAEPISALYEQGRIHHVGRFDELEDQMCTFSIDNVRGTNGNGSPDRVDALVWGLTEVFDKITSRRRREKKPEEILASNEYFKKRWQMPNRTHPTAWMAG
jgi:phage terminase large subunit-like protein